MKLTTDDINRLAANLSAAFKRGEPWAVCFVTNGLRELEQCITIDKDGNLVCDLDKGTVIPMVKND